ncbi:hypothetical protein ASF53_05095 [Methylobacterium sp. Leaf123]|uniref:hypothetical protein n=1 Tax=Methylobacterium sp. Leaf123 TaxID=1736264 RepID=UPI0006F1D305|nr:hypothetical protein [Methylobacterium sp. Leaf123]KQQ23704.1 hypothetical protein ASF53_05095 [Methylobacterium sp. Leaf123]
MSARLIERPVIGVNVMVLRDGRTVALEAIATAAEGQAILDDLDGAILGIEDQLAFDDGRNGPDWRKRAEIALKVKRRQRPALQQRIGELRRAEKQAARTCASTSHKDAQRKAFIDAAEELLPRETFVELWARAAEREPVVFVDAVGGGA